MNRATPFAREHRCDRCRRTVHCTTACGGTGTLPDRDGDDRHRLQRRRSRQLVQGRSSTPSPRRPASPSTSSRPDPARWSRGSRRNSPTRRPTSSSRCPRSSRRPTVRGLLSPAESTPPAIAADQVGRRGNYVPSSTTTLASSPIHGANPAPRPGTTCCTPSSRASCSTPRPARPATAPRCWCCCSSCCGKQGALDYLAKLQANNVGPSSSTGKAAAQGQQR